MTLLCRRNVGESLLTFKKVKRQLYRLRDKKYPKRPKTDEEIQNSLKDPVLFEEFGQTLDKKHPLYIDSVIEEGKYSFHVFTSLAMIGMVQKYILPGQRKYLMDGTFTVVPEQFRKTGQLLIIAIEYKNGVCKGIINLSKCWCMYT